MAASAALLFAACSENGEEALPAAGSPAMTEQTAAPTGPRDLRPDEYWLRGVVQDVRDGRATSGSYIATLQVAERLGGATVESGAIVTVLQGFGHGPYRCYGHLTEGLRPGMEVIVHAHPDETGRADVSTCAGERYFVLLTPIAAAATPPPPTCPPTHPNCEIAVNQPSPTCPPDWQTCVLWPDTEEPTAAPIPTCPAGTSCPFPARTVTIDLWSCDGGPCDGADESGCQRSVSLQVGDEFFEPDPFFCLVRFSNVPPSEYLVVVARRVACDDACEVLERCHVVASANRIAIEPVPEGECPAHTLR